MADYVVLRKSVGSAKPCGELHKGGIAFVIEFTAFVGVADLNGNCITVAMV